MSLADIFIQSTLNDQNYIYQCFNFEIPTSFKLYGPEDVNLFALFPKERSRFYNTFDAKYFLVNVTEGSL